MPRQVDVHVGQRIRHCRWILGMAQEELAKKIGLTPSDISMVESGKRPLDVAELYDIARATDVRMGFFFEGLDGEETATGRPPTEVMLEREVMELVRTFYGLPAGQRKGLLDLAHTLRDTGK